MPVRHLTISTSTGTFGPVDFGDAHRWVSYVGASTANKGYAGTVQGAIGGAGVWNTLLTLTTANSTDQVNTVLEATGADVVLFSKARVVLTKNNSTRVTGLWLAAR